MRYYKAFFYDKRIKDYRMHYIMTNDILRAKMMIEAAEEYVDVESWEEVSEADLPQVAVVIQK